MISDGRRDVHKLRAERPWLGMDERSSRGLVPACLFVSSVVSWGGACRFDTDSYPHGGWGLVPSGSGGSTAVVVSNPATQTGAAGVFSAAVSGATSAPVPRDVEPDIDAGAGPAQAGSAAVDPPPAPPVNPCDLSGHWLSTLHYVADAPNIQQITHDYVYYEITQQGDSFKVTKGLECGTDTESTGSVMTALDFKASWDAIASRATYTGRTGRSVVRGAGCQVDFDPWYTVRGASMPYYLDPSTSFPTAVQPAANGKPGWEDWDADGNPGITGVVSGSNARAVFVASRSWTAISGAVDSVATRFMAPMQWSQENNVMSYWSLPWLGSEAVPAPDEQLHFAEFARLAPGQTTGDDLTVCATLTQLASTLTPTAAAR